MKFHKLIFILFAGILLWFAPSAEAMVISSETDVVVAKGEIIDDDLFIAGESVVIEGTVEGDLYAAGGNVKVSGTVNGDVMVAGGTVEISGTVQNDVRVAGGSINITEAQIGDSLTTMGGNVNVDKSSSIGGGVLFGAGSINIDSDVTRGVMGGGGSVKINGLVGRDLRVGAGELSLGSDTVVSGDLVYSTEQKVQLLGAEQVVGRVRYIEPSGQAVTKQDDKPELEEGLISKLKFGMTAWSYLAALIVGGLALYLFKKPSQIIVRNLEKNWLSCLGWGFLLLIVTFPALLVLMVTGIGLPLAVILGMLFVIDLYLSKLVVGMALGKKIEAFFPKRKVGVYVSFALGLAVYYLLSIIPILGGFVRLVTLLLGLGALSGYIKAQLAKDK
jgi:hypothetical protein